MKIATSLVIDRLEANPEYLPPEFTLAGMSILLNFWLDNSCFEFNNEYYAQTDGGPMGSTLTVSLAEIRVAHLEEQALMTCPDPPS